MGRLLQKYLMASYIYYILHRSVMPDEEFDQMAKDLLQNWDTFEHQHKSLVTLADLEAGTLYSLSEKNYPGMVVGAALLTLERGPYVAINVS